MNDTRIDAAIRRSLEARGAERGHACPDDNLMAAWLDGALAPSEAQQVENHAASCGYCRRVIALAAAVEDEAPVAAPATVARRYAWTGFLQPRVLAMAAALAMVVGGSVLYRMSREGASDAAPVQVAELRQDVQREEPLADLRPADRELAPKAPEASAARPAVARSAAKAGFYGGITEPEVEGAAVAKKEVQAVAVEKDLLVGVETGVGEKAAAAPAAVQPQPVAAAAVAVGEIRQKERQEPAEQKQAVGAVAGRGAMGVRAVTAQAPADAVMEFRARPAESPQEAIRTMAGSLRDKAGAERTKMVGDRRFYRTAGYWVDVLCDQAAAVVEIPNDSTELAEVLRAIPGIAELRETDVPVLVFWKEKNLLLR